MAKFDFDMGNSNDLIGAQITISESNGYYKEHIALATYKNEENEIVILLEPNSFLKIKLCKEKTSV